MPRERTEIEGFGGAVGAGLGESKVEVQGSSALLPLFSSHPNKTTPRQTSSKKVRIYTARRITTQLHRHRHMDNRSLTHPISSRLSSEMRAYSSSSRST